MLTNVPRYWNKDHQYELSPLQLLSLTTDAPFNQLLATISSLFIIFRLFFQVTLAESTEGSQRRHSWCLSFLTPKCPEPKAEQPANSLEPELPSCSLSDLCKYPGTGLKIPGFSQGRQRSVEGTYPALPSSSACAMCCGWSHTVKPPCLTILPILLPALFPDKINLPKPLNRNTGSLSERKNFPLFPIFLYFLSFFGDFCDCLGKAWELFQRMMQLVYCWSLCKL